MNRRTKSNASFINYNKEYNIQSFKTLKLGRNQNSVQLKKILTNQKSIITKKIASLALINNVNIINNIFKTEPTIVHSNSIKKICLQEIDTRNEKKIKALVKAKLLRILYFEFVLIMHICR